jgi:hypothetical protein
MFAVGSFNSLALCDRQGWSHCQVCVRIWLVGCCIGKQRLCGSTVSVACKMCSALAAVLHTGSAALGVSAGAKLVAGRHPARGRGKQRRAAGGGSAGGAHCCGGAMLAAPAERVVSSRARHRLAHACPLAAVQAVVEDGRVSACLAEERVVHVTDMLSETQERLEFRDRVVMMSAGEAGWRRRYVQTARSCVLRGRVLKPSFACSAAGPRSSQVTARAPATPAQALGTCWCARAATATSTPPATGTRRTSLTSVTSHSCCCTAAGTLC